MTTRQPKTVFLLGNGRSGTRYLCGLFRNNAADCTAVHEPYLAASRPSMFGQAIYDFTHGNHDRLRQAFERKARGIRSYRTEWYVETSHAFIMSFADLAIEAFPDLKLVHVVRNPLQVCASQAERETIIRRWRMPLRDYRGDNGRLYFRWRLTGDEPIYDCFAGQHLSLFQVFLIQWIELENRAQAFLDRYDKRDQCVVLHTPRDLNDAVKIRAMFDTLGMRLKSENVALRGPQNRTPGSRRKYDEPKLQEEFRWIIERIPLEFLAIFARPPYQTFAWSGLLQKAAIPEPAASST